MRDCEDWNISAVLESFEMVLLLKLLEFKSSFDVEEALIGEVGVCIIFTLLCERCELGLTLSGESNTL